MQKNLVVILEKSQPQVNNYFGMQFKIERY
jgi:hypothetical protein